jgi:arginyl-tRNA synthetase
MKLLHNQVILSIAAGLEQAIIKAFPDAELKKEEIFSHIGEPPNLKLGHFAFPCFALAKAFRNSPVNIAKMVTESVEPSGIIKGAVATGPYINIKVNFKDIGETVVSDILSAKFFSDPIFSKQKTMMYEYSQPNTHKELHVGHMRNLCLGNALVRINRYAGHKVITATYPGDVGTHVAKCLWYLKFHNTSEMPKDGPKGPWLGSLYTKATLKLDEEKGTDKEDSNRSELTKILKEIEEGQGEYFDLWKETREWSLDLMKKVYKWTDIEFDRWFFESEVDAPSIALAKKLYADGILIEDDGAIGMSLKDEKLGFCMLIKSDGTGLYATKDIELAHRKFEEYGLDESIYVVDKRQAYHFQQVFKVLEKIDFPHACNSTHLQYDFVELPDGAMSSRKGNIVPLMDLIAQMEGTIKTEYLNKYAGDWSDEEINETAKIIANGAIKYGMIKMDNSRKIVFDMKEWLKLDGETGPYLQYVYARINSLCNKMNYDQNTAVDWSVLDKPQEEALILKMTQFNSIIEVASVQSKTNMVCSYLYELGKLYNSFYAECSVGKAENDAIKWARLALSKAVAQVMAEGLKVLGIQTPERM